MRDDDGFAGYVERHGRHLVQVGYLLTDDLPAARAVVERALSRAWLDWGRLGELPDPDSYFLRAVVTHRSSRGEVGGGPLAGLPWGQRAAVVLRYFEALPDGRMAAVMDVPQPDAHSLLESAVAGLDEAALGATLAERAEAVPDDALLPAVQAGADRVRRLRWTGIAAAGLVVVVVVGGVADLVLTASQRSPAAGAKPTLDPGALVGHTWYLVSWTTSGGQVVRATAAQELVITSRTHARTVTPSGSTDWALRLEKSTATGIPGRVADGDGVVAAVLQGTSTWQLVSDSLVWRQGSRSLTYSGVAQHG